MTASILAEFAVPDSLAGSAAGAWFWAMCDWPGVHSASLSGFGIGRSHATLRVRASARAMRRVRSFCTRRGFREVRE